MTWKTGPARALAEEAAELRETGVVIYGSGQMHKPSALTFSAPDVIEQVRVWRAMRAALDHYDQLIKDGRVACPCGGE